MSEPFDWIEDDILNLVKDRVEESLTLEFKACDSLRNKRWREELAKDVSAFANSAGGAIVYGIKENSFTHEAEAIDEGYDPTEVTKETLQRVIDSRIHRRIDGIRYNVIELATSRPGRIIFVLQIPESSLAPHMAEHRFYERYEFESKPMEEYEVRERYRRETFPGKDVVEAWRDDAINPLLSALESERSAITAEQWTWNRYSHEFKGLSRLCVNNNISANKEDFMSRHPRVTELLQEHDTALTALNAHGERLYDSLARSPIIKEAFGYVTSEESLKALITENPNRFKASTGSELFAELFGTNWDEQERLNSITEWAINSRAETNMDPLLVFWRAHGHRFCQCVVASDYFASVERARETLLAVINSAVGLLKQIRKELSERHNIPPEGRQQALNFYHDPFHL
jgi:Putative DNA-binding domain